MLIVGVLTWRAATTGVLWLVPVVVVAAALIAWLVRRSMYGGRKWADYALRGIFGGAIAGSIGLWAVVRITGYGSVEGWEDVMAAVYGMMGGFVGAIAGGAIGAIAGLWMDGNRGRPSGKPPV